jgi:hypothetical protein
MINEFIDAKSSVPPNLLISLADSVEQSYKFAFKFNSEYQLRIRLKSLGFMRDLRQLPRLIKQEILALTVLIKISWRVVVATGDMRDTLQSYIESTSRDFVAKEKQLASVSGQIQDPIHEETEGTVNGLNSIVVNTVLDEVFGGINGAVFTQNKNWIFNVLVGLIASNDTSVRAKVAERLNELFS